MTQVETVSGSQPRSRTIFPINRAFSPTFPTSWLTSTMSVLSSMTRTARLPGCQSNDVDDTALSVDRIGDLRRQDPVRAIPSRTSGATTSWSWE